MNTMTAHTTNAATRAVDSRGAALRFHAGDAFYFDGMASCTAEPIEPIPHNAVHAPRGATGRVWLVSRHAGTIVWAEQQGIHADRVVEHLDPDDIQPGDVVIGTLPVHVAAAVCARGGRFLCVSLDVPPSLRACELDADMMHQYGARLIAFQVTALADPPSSA